jgi:hypothetical protein
MFDVIIETELHERDVERILNMLQKALIYSSIKTMKNLE